MEEGTSSDSSRQTNGTCVSEEATQSSLSYQSRQASTGVQSASTFSNDNYCAKAALDAAKALRYTVNLRSDYGFLSPIVNTMNENERSCLTLLCEMPVSKRLLRNILLCYLANILKNFWQNDTEDIIVFGTSDSLSSKKEMQPSSRKSQQLMEAKISFLTEIENLIIDLQHENQQKGNQTIESRRPEFNKLKDYSFATVIRALRVLLNETSYGENAVQIEDSHSYVIKDYENWRITLRGEVTPADVHLNKHAISAAVINEHRKADLCLCYEIKVEDEWNIHAVFSVIALKELSSYKNCPTCLRETLMDSDNPIHQAIAHSHALELSSRLERCGSREDCYSLVLYCGRGVNKSGLYCIEYCIEIPKLGGIYRIYQPFRQDGITRGSYETCNALLKVLIYGLRNIKIFKTSETLEVVSYLGKIPEDLKYISSPICDSLAQSDIQMNQGCLFELPSSKLSRLKESLKLEKHNDIKLFDLLQEENITDCESIENVYIKIIAPPLNGIALPFAFRELQYSSSELKDILSRGLFEVWRYKESHWFIMKIMQEGEIQWDILRDNWSKFWDFAIILASNCTAEFTYLDLRPKLENLRFIGNEFVLLDYDSFGEIPYRTTDGRYPQAAKPAIYVLRQVTAAIWATFKKIKERELIDKFWNIRKDSQFEDFQEFCTPELDVFWLKESDYLKIKDVKEVFYKVANTLSTAVHIDQILS